MLLQLSLPLHAHLYRKLDSPFYHRSLVFRDIVVADGSYKISCGHRQMASNGTVYDMALDRSEEVAVTVGQVCNILKFPFRCALDG